MTGISEASAGMTVERIEAILQLAEQNRVTAFEIEENGARLHLRFDQAQQRNVAPAAPHSMESRQDVVSSLGVGFFRGSHPLVGASTEPRAGSALQDGDVIGFVQSGLVLQPVRAPAAATLGAALVEEGATVGFGTPLFRLE